MQPKAAPWNLKNKNVLIVAGKHIEEFALKYGIVILQNEINLIPCKYLAVYKDDTIKHLFEVTKMPLDNITEENSAELRDIRELEGSKAEVWEKGKKAFRMITVQKIADVGPIINDYISPHTGKLHPLTVYTPRYTTYERVMKAKLTSELQCYFDEDDIPEKEPEVIAAPPPPPPEKKKNMMPVYISAAAVITAIIIAVVFITTSRQEPQQKDTTVVVKEVIKEKLPENIIFGGNFFDSGKSDIKKESVPYLKNALKVLQEYPEIKVKIVGHTDNMGQEDENLRLSAARAKSVMDWFIENGIDSTRLSYEGKGSAEPVADNNTEEGRMENRRTEIIVISKDKNK